MDASSGAERWEKEITGDRQAGIARRQTGSFRFLLSLSFLATVHQHLRCPHSFTFQSLPLLTHINQFLPCSAVNHASLPQP